MTQSALIQRNREETLMATIAPTEPKTELRSR